ncbi:phage shock protein E [Tenacibaculum sp. 190524A02b]|uniref:Phage shock protein E n=1 Tax=Tenacibaculum vairaonense TaxID=3137860 RepID=A0ABM9PQT3_9FLAO
MKNIVYLFIFTIAFTTNAQKNLEQLLKKFNTESVPYISVTDLKKSSNITLLDAREPKEFKVSHIENAICVGYDNFNLKETLTNLPSDKNAKIVVYCSLGIRSEDIAEKLHKAGYTNIYNLYGGIFEWKNQNNSVVNKQNKTTDKIHTFNKEWSKWLTKGKKVY